jgi:hypothetical protein
MAAAEKAVIELRPTDGRLLNEQGIKQPYRAGVWLTDLIVEATFYNPYSNEEGCWSYGLNFRKSENNFHEIQIIGSSPPTVNHVLVIDRQASRIYSDNVPINQGSGESNTVRIVTFGEAGQLWLNGRFMTNLDLSGLTEPGNVELDTEVVPMCSMNAFFTDFSDFTVWSLD